MNATMSGSRWVSAAGIHQAPSIYRWRLLASPDNYGADMTSWTELWEG